MYVVGDSLSDTGNIFYALGGTTVNPPYSNLIPSAAYSSQRLSNGPIWVERLAENLDIDLQASLIGGTSYAFGAALTGSLTGISPSLIPTLTDQAQSIVNLPGTLSTSDLFVVWGGGNDIRKAASTGSGSEASTIINDSLLNISGVITLLANEGATRFLVPNLPDLGALPSTQLAGPFAVSFMSQLTESFNNNLEFTILSELEQSLGVEIIHLDANDLLADIVSNPDNFGFTDVTNACIQIGGGECSAPDEYLFWDGLHPTTAAHQIIGDAAYASLVPVPAALPFFIAAISMLGLYSNHKK